MSLPSHSEGCAGKKTGGSACFRAGAAANHPPLSAVPKSMFDLTARKKYTMKAFDDEIIRCS